MKYDPDSRNGEANVLVDKRYIVSVKGDAVDKNDVLDYAKAVDYKGLKDF